MLRALQVIIGVLLLFLAFYVGASAIYIGRNVIAMWRAPANGITAYGYGTIMVSGIWMYVLPFALTLLSATLVYAGSWLVLPRQARGS